jgi:predicted enzyme related to lactoylglutathione lyase
MFEDGKIAYVELTATNLAQSKEFYAKAFGWGFTDYGPTYAAFENAGLDGGFQANAEEARPAPLVIVYATDLEAMLAKVQAAGAEIIIPIFAYPGGRRFHFRDPAGNELAVFSND